MSNPITWRNAVRQALTDQRRRADFRESVERCLKVYINGRGPDEITTSPSWAKEDLAEFGIKRTTWWRVWRWLIDSQLLGWVAWGREHAFKPAALKADDKEKGDDRAVYVMTMPLSADQEPPAASDPVDISGTVTPEGESFSSHPPHAHTYTTDAANAPHCLKNTSGGFAALAHRLLPAVPKLWRGDMTAKESRKNKAVRAVSQDHFARTLKHFVPALDRPQISDRHLASVLRQMGFFDADWTVNDIRYALDRQFDGTPWPHDGATGVGSLAKWLAYRLEPWRDELGRPRQSPSQRQRTEQAEARVRARHEAERIARENARLQRSLVSGTFAQGIAMLRKTVRGGV